MKHAPQECWKNAKRLVLTLAKDTQQVYVLYGSLDLDVPGIGPVRLQQQLKTEKKCVWDLRRNGWPPLYQTRALFFC